MDAFLGENAIKMDDYKMVYKGNCDDFEVRLF